MLAAISCGTSADQDRWIGPDIGITAVYGAICETRWLSIANQLSRQGRPTALDFVASAGDKERYWAVNVHDLSRGDRLDYEASGQTQHWDLYELPFDDAPSWYAVDFNDGTNAVAYRNESC